MSDFRFEWKCSENKNHLMYATFIHEHDAWLSALSKCGWDNRTTLRTTNEKGYTIRNWFEASHGLTILSHPANKKSDRLYKIKNFWKGK